MHTWYMTKENYADMYAGKLTEVFVPLFSRKNYAYNLTIIGSLFHSTESFKCFIQTPSARQALMPTMLHRNVDQLRHSVPAISSNSGVYSIQCVVLYDDILKGNSSNMTLTKSLMITFFKGLLCNYITVQQEPFNSWHLVHTCSIYSQYLWNSVQHTTAISLKLKLHSKCTIHIIMFVK